MQEKLINRLHHFLEENYPELLIELETVGRVTDYLKEKVNGIDPLLDKLLTTETAPHSIEEVCFNELIAAYGPSRFNYILAIVQEDYETVYNGWRHWNILVNEVINITGLCKPFFEHYGFSEEKLDDPEIRISVGECIRVYIEKNSENENREIWDTMYSKN